MVQDTFDQILVELEQKTGSKHEKVETRDIPLSGGELPAGTEFDIFVDEMTAQGVAAGLTEDQARKLVKWYGTNAETVFGLKDQAEAINLPLDVALSLVYGLTHEMIISPVDFFLRRTDILLFNTGKVADWKETVIDYMAEYFGWTAEETDKWSNTLDDAITHIQLTKFR